MDQDAFRALLSTTNPSQSTQHSRPNGRLVLGGGSTNRSTNPSQPSGSTYKPVPSTSLKPRKSKPKEPADGTVKGSDRSSHGGYRDRASERRQGLDGDFAEAEHLLENFQARVAAAGSQMDKDVLEQQTKYLGGDERHTILVKGLDHALLERRKAELSEGGKLGQVTDDDLEIAYQQNGNKAPSEEIALPSTSSKAAKKKHRDELLEQLKAARTPADLVVVEKLKAAGKFKPIGFTSVQDKNQDEERKERKRRKAEKKKKKAIKAEQAVEPTPPSLVSHPLNDKSQSTGGSKDTSTAAETPAIDGHEDSSPQTAKKPVEPSNNTAPVVTLPDTNVQPKEIDKKNEPIEDEDFDIFGDAGEYKGLDDDSSDDERDRDRKVQADVPRDAGLDSSGPKKRKTYFEDDDDESEPDDPVKPKPIEQSVCRAHDARRKTMEIEDPEEDPEARYRLPGEAPPPDQAPPPRPTKLEGLSGSADIRSILAADAFQEKEEKRKAKKQKNKSDGVDKVLSDKDRLNRDVLEMENYLKRKKNKSAPAATTSKS
ncbi:hypothetical protein PTTG_01695 [Puccinia triticina 1-1 BBBD Race 1]|uniref:RED_N domain-containing protein n=1 Tax=Puccinia triticina (isolate 1-1 / race 1 (BBBD)) TaxID=630390 RepID=A0A180H2B9_PUCT1|nr:hypothetical protein PTTG_01695 [Puccinia triticina 1-1 BBBD Race 1]